ncbi:MAG: hypothetical protein U9P42_00230 [Candidatus Fermentibacteria bacterium]|nr:hypothetical protein [Candidatus Fermentibacteria bacterium]
MLREILSGQESGDGRVVYNVEADSFPAGEHAVSWIPSSELASGCHLIRLQTDAGN